MEALVNLNPLAGRLILQLDPSLTVAQLEGESLLARQFFTFPFAVSPRAQSGGSLASRC
jgi:hypothetical protein